MTMNLSQFTNLSLIDTPIVGLVLNDLAYRPAITDLLFMNEMAERYKEVEQQVADFGEFAVKAEGATYPTDVANEEYQATYIQVNYGKLFAKTKFLDKFELFGYMRQLAGKIANAMVYTRDKNAMAIFNNGFGTFTSPDGVALFSAAHTRKNSATTDTNIITAADLNATSLNALITVVRKTTDPRGKYLNMMPIRLLGPVDLEKEMVEVTKSDLRPGTTDNDVNAVKFRAPNLDWVSSPHLSDADAWFIQADRHYLKRKFSEGLAVSSQVDFYTDNLMTKAGYMEDYGVSDWRGIYGSAGA